MEGDEGMSVTNFSILPSVETEVVVSVSDIRCSFETPKGAVRAVRGVSFDLCKGEVLGVVGESGSGKSVLVRTLMGLHEDSETTTVSGQVLIRGRTLQERTRAEQRVFFGSEMAMVFQNPRGSLNPVRTIGAQIRTLLKIHLRLRGRAATERAEELLAAVGIPEPRRRLHLYPHELSGGMCQRIALAMAIATEPAVLIADEPTTALDVSIQRQILDLISDLTERRRMATILVTHDLGVVAGRANRVLVMYAGKVIEDASTRELFRDARHPYTDGLLRCVPRLGRPDSPLVAIPGTPVDPRTLPPGCAFQHRCSRVTDRCATETPILTDDGIGHPVACWNPISAERTLGVDQATDSPEGSVR